jgi:hypothetical protein
MRHYIIITFFVLFICTSTFGHSGRTDSSGGHYNRKTGQYHYHNGGGGSGIGWVIIIGGVLFFLFLKSGDNKK